MSLLDVFTKSRTECVDAISGGLTFVQDLYKTSALRDKVVKLVAERDYSLERFVNISLQRVIAEGKVSAEAKDRFSHASMELEQTISNASKNLDSVISRLLELDKVWKQKGGNENNDLASIVADLVVSLLASGVPLTPSSSLGNIAHVLTTANAFPGDKKLPILNIVLQSTPEDVEKFIQDLKDAAAEIKTSLMEFQTS